jgi:uncharacterized protein (TIGR02444 family)
MSSIEPNASPFWTFTLAAYGRAGMPAACIGLQDRLTLDVNFLLFSLFAGSLGASLGLEQFTALEAAVGPWRASVIHPLRAVRRWLKEQALVSRDAVESLRQSVLSSEIAAEGQQQRLMERHVVLVRGSPSIEAAAGNLQTYLRWARATPAADDREDLVSLLHGAFDGVSRDQARQYFASH